MSLASEIWNWQDGDRVSSRLTTNIGRERLIARLSAVGLLDAVESIHAYFGDRVDGGNGYELLWKKGVCLSDLRPLLFV
jgi:hypothetical protein